MAEWQDPEDYLEQADRDLEDGRYEDALAACERALDLDPDLADAHALAGRCLAYLNRIDEAERRLLRALDLDRDCLEAWFGLAFVSWLRADDREALNHLERCRRLAPDDEAVLGQLIGAYGNVGEFEEARRLYEEASRIHPESAEIPYQWGQVLYRAGRYREAIDAWTRALQADDTYPDLHLSTARAWAALGDLDRAHREIQAELDLYPDAREPRLALANYHMQRGQPDRAVRILRRLLREDEGDSRVHLDLGIALARMGRNAEARRHLLRALELTPSDPLILSYLTTTGQTRADASRAKRILRRAIREEPHRDELYRNLAALLAGEGRFEEAEAQLRQALAFSGRPHELQNDLGVLLAIQGRFEEAREAFDRGLAQRPDDVPLAVNRALIEADLGRTDEALRRLRALAEAHPENLDAQGNLASVLLEAGRPEESLVVARRLCRLAPFDPRGYYLTGRALYELGHYEEAEAALDRAARLDPMQVDTAIALGMCHAALGRRRRCRQAFEQARRLAPNDPDVLFNLGLAYEDAAEAGGDPSLVDEAVGLYRRVLRLSPAYEPARRRLQALGLLEDDVSRP